MAWAKAVFHFVYNVQGLIRWGGLGLVAFIIFAETGLFFGFFLPGDSLLVTAGIFAKAGDLPVASLLLLTALAAVLGNQTGYVLGRRLGHRMVHWRDSLFFKKKYVARTHEFYARHGAKTIFLARFVPIIRTFAPLVAGIGEMRYARFMGYTVAGALAWTSGLVLAGYGLASLIPDVGQKIHLVIVVVIIVSLIPAAWELLRGRAVIPRKNA
ncbi:MAG: VTT domain-containing protein [Elusimicrobia bacterium]|nr:VTT domain-containing protein [Elusimicrobiota bacterium]